MAVKTYAPVRINNPGEGHLVPLMPGQGFIVTMTGTDPELEYSSEFFELIENYNVDGDAVYHFVQKYDLQLWSRVSKVFLGEIVVMSGNRMGSMCVFLDTTNKAKSSLLTVINPEMCIIKADASNLLEVVIYDENFLGEWNCNIISGYCGLKYEQVEYRKIDPQQFSFSWQEIDRLYFSLPRSSMFGPFRTPIREHHYFFRYDYPSITAIAQMSAGVYTGGKIVFDAHLNVGNFKVLNVNLNIRDKHKSKLFTDSKILNSKLDFTTYRTYYDRSGRARSPQVRDSLMRHTVSLHPKDDTELHSNRVVYF